MDELMTFHVLSHHRKKIFLYTKKILDTSLIINSLSLFAHCHKKQILIINYRLEGCALYKIMVSAIRYTNLMLSR